MSTESGDFRTPGQLIEALLTSKGWTKRVLAIVLDMDETGINRLVADKRPVDAAMALNLEALFGVPAERFLELQKSYDLAKARISAKPPDPGRATRAHLFGGLPIAEMIKRGWLQADTGGLMLLSGAILLAYAQWRWVMGLLTSRNRKDNSCSDARPMTFLERELMERATLELHEELSGLLQKRKPRFGFRLKKKEPATA